MASAVAEQFWSELGSDPVPADRELCDRTAELLAEGYTRRQLVAVAWVAAGEWAKIPRQRERAQPTWALKPGRLIRMFGRGRPVSEWLEKAAERWREENGARPPPWIRRGPPPADEGRGMAEAAT